MSITAITVLFLASLGLSPRSSIQEQPPAAEAPQAAAVPEEARTIEGLIAATYAEISGPIGQKRDADKMRSHFHPEARLIPVGPNRQGKIGARILTVEDYIKRAFPYMEEKGFFESEIHRKVERFGSMAQVFSTYESRSTPEAAPFARGINGFQLFHDGERWWVMNIMWFEETPETPIPAEFLPAPK